MKKEFVMVIISGMLALSACAGTSPLAVDNASASSQAGATDVLTTSYDNAAPIATQLLVGTLKLAGTDTAVTKDQATALLPLWSSYKTISQSIFPARRGASQAQTDTTPVPQSTITDTQKQLSDLTTQILAVMTPKQITAIAAMKITQETAVTSMNELGITMGGPQQGGGNQPPQGTPPASDQQGNGNQPPQGGGNNANGNRGSGALARRGGGMIPNQLIDAVVQALQTISGS